jgi:hypothetical protein
MSYEVKNKSVKFLKASWGSSSGAPSLFSAAKVTTLTSSVQMETTVNPLLTQALPPEITVSWIRNHSIYHALFEQMFQAFKQTSRRIFSDTLLRAQAKNFTIMLEG